MATERFYTESGNSPPRTHACQVQLEGGALVCPRCGSHALYEVKQAGRKSTQLIGSEFGLACRSCGKMHILAVNGVNEQLPGESEVASFLYIRWRDMSIDRLSDVVEV